MERLKEAGTPNVAMGQARERARSMQQAVTYLSFEEEPLPQRWSASVDADESEPRDFGALSHCGKKHLQSSDK